MNWGYPRTWEGFKHAIFRGQYEKMIPSSPLNRAFPDQIALFFSMLTRQFTLPLGLLGVIPFGLWAWRTDRKELNGFKLLFCFLIIFFVAYVPARIYANYTYTDLYSFSSSIMQLITPLLFFFAAASACVMGAHWGIEVLNLTALFERAKETRLKDYQWGVMYGLLAISVVSIVALLFKLDMDAVENRDGRASQRGRYKRPLRQHNPIQTTRPSSLRSTRSLCTCGAAYRGEAASRMVQAFVADRLKDDAIYAHVLAFGALMASVTFMYFNPVSLDHVYDLIENFGENVGVLAKLACMPCFF